MTSVNLKQLKGIKITIIAWDGDSLAADKQCTSNGLRRTVTKVFEYQGKGIGIAGYISQGLALLEWYKKGCNPNDYPEFQKGEDDAILVVADRNSVITYGYTHCPIVYEDSIFATGSGRDYALAAMYLGKSAREAVLVASHFEEGCGMGVDEIIFEKVPF
jgi:ATP-dependent protease HslVU (ClpYQ) peptidase subunit